MSTLRAAARALHLVASPTVLVLTVAIVVLASCSDLEAAQSQKRSGARSGSVAVATKYYEDNLSKCGDSYIAIWTFSDRSGSHLIELKGVRYNTSPIPISQADRLNGLEDAFESWIQPTAARRTGSPRDNWEPWRDEKSVFHFRFLKMEGNWSVAPVFKSPGGLSGFLAKYPCNEVPGHPARLAREEAEQRLAAQARQVRAVSFTCGPVRDYSGYGTQSISVTDASVTGIDGLPSTAVGFIDAQYLSKFDKDRLDGPGIWLSARRPYNPGGEWGFRFRGPSAEANRDACYDAIAASYERWRARFPTLAKLKGKLLYTSQALEAVKQEAAKKGISRERMGAIGEAIESYKLANGQAPAKLDDLVPQFLASNLVTDPWGNPYKYLQRLESDKYVLIGFHPDGSPDTDLWLSRPNR